MEWSLRKSRLAVSTMTPAQRVAMAAERGSAFVGKKGTDASGMVEAGSTGQALAGEQNRRSILIDETLHSADMARKGVAHPGGQDEPYVEPVVEEEEESEQVWATGAQCRSELEAAINHGE